MNTDLHRTEKRGAAPLWVVLGISVLLTVLLWLVTGCGTLQGRNYGGEQPWRHTNGAPWYGPDTAGVLGATVALEAQPWVHRAMVQWVRVHPVCSYCGRSNHLAGCVLNAHHIRAAHTCTGEFMQLLTNPINFVSLCRDPDGIGDHGRWGHGTNGHFISWSYNNPAVVFDCAAHQIDLRARR